MLGGKYTVLEVMGRGSNGVTYKVITGNLLQCLCHLSRSSYTYPRARQLQYMVNGSMLPKDLVKSVHVRHSNSTFIGTNYICDKA